MDRIGQDINGVYAQLVRTVGLIHQARLQYNFKLAPLPDSVFNRYSWKVTKSPHKMVTTRKTTELNTENTRENEPLGIKSRKSVYL